MDHLYDSAMTADWVQPTISDIHAIAGLDGMLDADFLDLVRDAAAIFDSADSLWKVNGKILIPAGKIRTNLMVMAHGLSSGHRGRDNTVKHLQELVYWPSMAKDVSTFIDRCIVCQAFRPQNVKRPYGKPLTPTYRNEILSVDFLHLPSTAEGFNVVFVLMDKLSNFMMLYKAKSESSEAAFEGIKTCGSPNLGYQGIFLVTKVLVLSTILSSS